MKADDSFNVIFALRLGFLFSDNSFHYIIHDVGRYLPHQNIDEPQLIWCAIRYVAIFVVAGGLILTEGETNVVKFLIVHADVGRSSSSSSSIY